MLMQSQPHHPDPANYRISRESLATANNRTDVRAWLWPGEQDDVGRWIKYVVHVVGEEQIDWTALDCWTPELWT
jgi:hypothetical protein